MCFNRFFSSNRKILTTMCPPVTFPELQDVSHRKYNISSEVYSMSTEITEVKPAITSLNKWTMSSSSLMF